MQKKTDIQDLDIPKDDIECWERYPKHHWVYDLSRLLDAQHIKWSPYETGGLHDRELNMELHSTETIIKQPGFIYINKSPSERLWTEVYIAKGEIKHMRHVDIRSKREIPGLLGEIELRINAFVTLYFQKFTGIISVQSVGSDIFAIRLRSVSELALETNADIIKHIKRIYKKTDSHHIIGPADQVFQEALAS